MEVIALVGRVAVVREFAVAPQAEARAAQQLTRFELLDGRAADDPVSQMIVRDIVGDQQRVRGSAAS